MIALVLEFGLFALEMVGALIEGDVESVTKRKKLNNFGLI